MDTYGGRNGMLALVCPSWLQGEYGLSWSAGLGDILDDVFDGTKDAVKLRMPGQASTAGDSYALALFGQDSSLPRYPVEGLSEYGARLSTRWGRYDRSGAAPRVDGSGCPILEDLEGIGFGSILLREYHDWPELTAYRYDSPPPVEDVYGDPWWSRVWIYIEEYQGDVIPEGSTLDGLDALDADFYLDVTLDPAAVASAVRSTQTWAPAHVSCKLVYLPDGVVAADILGIGFLDVDMTLH